MLQLITLFCIFFMYTTNVSAADCLSLLENGKVKDAINVCSNECKNDNTSACLSLGNMYLDGVWDEGAGTVLKLLEKLIKNETKTDLPLRVYLDISKGKKVNKEKEALQLFETICDTAQPIYEQINKQSYACIKSAEAYAQGHIFPKNYERALSLYLQSLTISDEGAGAVHDLYKHGLINPVLDKWEKSCGTTASNWVRQGSPFSPILKAPKRYSKKHAA